MKFALASLINWVSKKKTFLRLGLESHGRTNALGCFLEGARLPIRAHLMNAGIHGKEKIGFAFVGPDPRAIESNPHRGAAFNVLEDVNDCLFRIRPGDRVLLAVRLYVEIRLAVAAAAAGRSRRRWFLRKQARSENRQEHSYGRGFHHSY